MLGGRHLPDLFRAARELVVLTAHVLDVAAVRRPDHEERLLDLGSEVGQVRRWGGAGEDRRPGCHEEEPWCVQHPLETVELLELLAELPCPGTLGDNSS